MTQEQATDQDIDALLEVLLATYHYDFRQYARSSLRRRIELAVDRLGTSCVADLRELVRVDAAAFSHLLDQLTVPVSDLFRDPRYFRDLREQVVPVLRTYPSIKVWIAGCSTGEEVYSLTILLHEEGLLDRTLVYATDINPASLRKAEAGVYDLERLRRFSESYQLSGGRSSLSDYYRASSSAAVFDRRLRKQVVFSDHSLATDNVFSEVHLVSCRNVLIYFNRALQDRAVGLFTEALCRHGFLGLGLKETLRFGPFATRFEDVSTDTRIYRRKD